METTSTSQAPTLVVLAAGMGSRFGGLKQMTPLGPGGETLLDYSVFDAKRAGFGRVVFVIRRDFAEQFEQSVAARFAHALDVALVFQEMSDLPAGFTVPADRQKPWGTGHATLAARHVVKEPFAVINADDFYGRDSFATLAGFLRQPGLSAAPCRACMVGFTMKNTLSEHGKVARGVCRVSGDGLLESVEELTDLFPTPTGAENRPAEGDVRAFTGEEPVSMNMWGFAPELFPAFEEGFGEFLATNAISAKAEYYIPAALDRLIQAGRETCRVLRSDASWFGVTYPDDAALVREALAAEHAAGTYPARLWT